MSLPLPDKLPAHGDPSFRGGPGPGCSPDGAGRGGDGADQAPEVGLGDVDPQRGDLRVQRPEGRGGGLLLGEQRRELDLDGRAGESERAPVTGGSALGGDAGVGCPSPPAPQLASRNPCFALVRTPQPRSQASFSGACARETRPSPNTYDVVPNRRPRPRGLTPACCARHRHTAWGPLPTERREHRSRRGRRDAAGRRPEQHRGPQPRRRELVGQHGGRGGRRLWARLPPGAGDHTPAASRSTCVGAGGGPPLSNGGLGSLGILYPAHLPDT